VLISSSYTNSNARFTAEKKIVIHWLCHIAAWQRQKSTFCSSKVEDKKPGVDKNKT
jgi:hypothetical protein